MGSDGIGWDAYCGASRPGKNLRLDVKSSWIRPLLTSRLGKAMLESDERFRGLYIMLDRVDVHCVWVSQAVLDLLPKDLPDIPGGEIVRDPGMGVFCDNAMEFLLNFWPRPDNVKKATFLKSAMESLHSVGLVGMHDAGVNPDELRLYKELSRTDDWTLRVYAMIECRERNAFCPEEVSSFTDNGGFLTIKSVKLFAGTSESLEPTTPSLSLPAPMAPLNANLFPQIAWSYLSLTSLPDGALGSWGSAMINPYTDRPDTSGSLLVNASTLTSLARSWSSQGYQVNIHAIGDLANRLAVDALEAALADLCPADDDHPLSRCQAQRRFRIEHAQIIHPSDQARIKALGILASVQPTHATSDMKYAGLRLGLERLAAEAYRMRSLRDSGLVLGSDFPVEPPNPFEGIYAAVARRNPHTGKGADGKTKESWHPEEALTLREALTGFTEGPAYGAFLEGRAGMIQPGAMADWVVLDQPLEQMDIEDLRTLKVRETWVGGRRVYAKD